VTLTRTTADAVLKEFYLPGIRSILNNEVFLLTQVEQNTEDVEGRRAVLAINTGRNHGVGARAEMGPLPTAGQQGYREERVQLKYNYGRIEISGPTIRSMGSDRGSFTRAVQSETQGVVRDLRNDMNRQLYGDGTGAIAVAASNVNLDITLDDPTKTQLRQLQVGMRVDIGTAANPTATVANRAITAVNTSTGVVSIEGPGFTITADDIITRAGSGGTGAAQKEVTGLQAQVADSGALWNIDPANTPNWVSYVDDPGSGRAVSEDMFMEAQQEVNIASGEDLNLWVTDNDVHRAVARLLTSIKRFPSTTELRGGYTALDMSSVSQGNTGSNTVSMFYDKDCPTGVAFGLTTKRIQWYTMSDWEFMEEDGAVLSRVPNVDAYEATLFIYAELATDGRNAHAKLGSLDPTMSLP
jgi:hypothetical protein